MRVMVSEYDRERMRRAAERSPDRVLAAYVVVLLERIEEAEGEEGDGAKETR